jgi:hypothetical protein
MPLVIQELVITTTVSDAPPPGTGSSPPTAPPADLDARQALVADCVEEVMRILREKAER